MASKSGNNDVVTDSTDPGTLRPDIEPEEATKATEFEPSFCPEFDPKINLPIGLDSSDVFGI